MYVRTVKTRATRRRRRRRQFRLLDESDAIPDDLRRHEEPHNVRNDYTNGRGAHGRECVMRRISIRTNQYGITSRIGFDDVTGDHCCCLLCGITTRRHDFDSTVYLIFRQQNNTLFSCQVDAAYLSERKTRTRRTRVV